MRSIIAALQVSLDGFIEGPNREVDWVDSWEDTFDIVDGVDALVLGGNMYPGYEQFWGAIDANPELPLPTTGKPPTEGEVAYARFASATPHYVLSRRLEHAAWNNTRIVRNLEEIAILKQQAGKDIHAVGGATLVGSLLDAGLVDEIRLTVHPVLLGGGTALFKDVRARHALELRRVQPLGAGKVDLRYGVP